ncbi:MULTISPECIES: hypothetical protein [Pseudomonas]|uniref:Lipoprotein n=1 Tax=Pseudomonas fluorescens TaxID=294 RepID=A0A5E6TUW4_PSEFL|nr:MULTISPECIES: hypothetical protein [Pseudomonas]VVM97221.1 hypothetical protein PS652_03101 [Pseudomonas fluorescens]
MRIAKALIVTSAVVLLQGCFDEPKHIDKDTDRSKPSLQMQQPDAHSKSADDPEQPKN